MFDHDRLMYKLASIDISVLSKEESRYLQALVAKEKDKCVPSYYSEGNKDNKKDLDIDNLLANLVELYQGIDRY